MIWLGAQCVRRAVRMGRGDTSARVEFLQLAGVMLLVVLPIIPIQPFFGAIGTALSVIALLVVGLGGRARATSRTPAGTSDIASIPAS
jgi:hypothetical protein